MFAGVIFMLGPQASSVCMESLRGGNNREYFNVLDEYEPEDEFKVYKSERHPDLNYNPLIGKAGAKNILFCPVTPSAVKEGAGTLRERVKEYIPKTKIAIGIGTAGSYNEMFGYGYILLPEMAESSEKIKSISPEESEKGCADGELMQNIMDNHFNESFDIQKVPKWISLADKEEVAQQTPDFKRERFKNGYSGSDMETSWFLRYAKIQKAKSCSMQIIADLPEDRPFESTEDKTKEMNPLSMLKRNESLIYALELAIKTILGKEDRVNNLED